MPGFIDTHVHSPQLDVIASFGTELLDWLNTYTFPAEMRMPTRRWPRPARRSSWTRCWRTAPRRRWCSRRCTRTSVDALFAAAQAARHAHHRRQGADGPPCRPTACATTSPRPNATVST
jgi:guanine deaminase